MSGPYEIVPLDASLDAEWDQVVMSSDEGWLFCLSVWQHHASSISEWSYRQLAFGLRRAGRLVAVMPLQLTCDGVLMSMAMGNGGLVIASFIEENEREQLKKYAYRCVEELAREYGASRIIISISPLSRSALRATTGVNPLVEQGYEDTSTHTRIIDLLGEQSKIWEGLSYDARRSVKKASQAGYVVEKMAWESVLDDYYRIHAETYRRTGVSPHPIAYFGGIAHKIAPLSHAVLWGARAPNGQLVAFHNDARFADTSLYWTGCCESDHLSAGVNYLLFWEAIKSAHEDGCRWYEVGEVFPHIHEGKLHGLSVFKGKFGGELHRYFRGELRMASDATRMVDAVKLSEFSMWMVATRNLIRSLVRSRPATRFDSTISGSSDRTAKEAG